MSSVPFPPNLIWNLISRRAFIPDPLNEECPLSERFARRPLVAVDLHRGSIDAAVVSFGTGEPVLADAEHFEFVEEGSGEVFLSNYAERRHARECVASLNYGFKISVTTRAQRPALGTAEVQWMRREPERVLGEALEAGQRPALAFHPTHAFAFLFTLSEQDLAKAADFIGKANLGVARMQIGICSLMRHVIECCWELVGRSAQVLVVSPAVVFHAVLHERRFEEPGYAALRPGEVMEEVMDRLAKLRPATRIILINDSPHDIAALVSGRGVENEIVEPLKGRSHPLLRACCLH